MTKPAQELPGDDTGNRREHDVYKDRHRRRGAIHEHWHCDGKDPSGAVVTAKNVDHYFGVAPPDSTAPVCSEKSYTGPPFHGTMTFQDTRGSGLASLTIVKNVNSG